jgi:haloacetate dehalogenase
MKTDNSPSLKFFPGFKPLTVTSSAGININGVVGGNGPPLLLIHGCPTNLASWRKVAPKLAERFTVVATDLRGFGDSDMPAGGTNHENYSKRAMAQDQVEVMTHLGFDRFHVVGHDRGGRVAHRLAIDHDDKVTTLTLLDVMPTLYSYENVDRKFAESYWWWFFLSAPSPIPETFIEQSSEFWIDMGFFGRREMIEQEAFDNFVRTMQRKGSAHAQCEDYRAGATIDLEHDRADFDKKLTCPLLVLWGDMNPLYQGKDVDVLSPWRERANDVRGHGVPSAHWIMEQVPDQLIEELTAFVKENC